MVGPGQWALLYAVPLPLHAPPLPTGNRCPQERLRHNQHFNNALWGLWVHPPFLIWPLKHPREAEREGRAGLGAAGPGLCGPPSRKLQASPLGGLALCGCRRGCSIRSLRASVPRSSASLPSEQQGFWDRDGEREANALGPLVDVGHTHLSPSLPGREPPHPQARPAACPALCPMPGS